ncbi:hypothetical protein AV942_16000 [Alteromonas mediterranea]|uniref:Uncharacterized protein n=1 Tax=Alteromonas mediterranea TaxID=314275 RepID=A0AAC8XLN4_9ALTE|nr:hypothetical protein AV942_16000 [Alteromonas mediterranea]AMJ83843.1 hypothetical protein AV941_16085 [Alteromonas mediterranea]
MKTHIGAMCVFEIVLLTAFQRILYAIGYLFQRCDGEGYLGKFSMVGSMNVGIPTIIEPKISSSF